MRQNKPVKAAKGLEEKQFQDFIFQFISDNAPDFYLLCDVEGRILYVNRIACEPGFACRAGHQAEPGGQCVPRQSLGTRKRINGPGLWESVSAAEPPPRPRSRDVAATG